MDTLNEWHLCFSTAYFQLTGTVPFLLRGNDPAQDIAAIEYEGVSKTYWVLYPIEKFDSDYWMIFLALFEQYPQIKLNLSTALVLTEQLLGGDVFDLAVPDCWVLSVEYIADTIVL